MSLWTPKQSIQLATPLPVPDDGIATSNQRPGWVGKAWRDLIENAPNTAEDRVARGRNYARRGRVRDLRIDPGAASAEVICAKPELAQLRVEGFGPNAWHKVEKALTSKLTLLAELLEGELSPRLVEALETSGVPLMPRWDEISFSCSCDDHEMPCTHGSALYHVLADAIDGDPFLLLTLRGRPRDQLLGHIRRHWGDDTPVVPAAPPLDEPDPEADWFASPSAIPDFPTSLSRKVEPGAGLLSLGPPPDDADLRQALLPLYERGAELALAAREAIPERAPMKLRAAAKRPAPIRFDDGEDDLDVPEPTTSRAPAPPAVPEAPPPEPAAPPIPITRPPLDPPPAPKPIGDDDLTEALVDHLATREGLSARQLARELGLLATRVDRELLELESLGIVIREHTSGAPTWRLG